RRIGDASRFNLAADAHARVGCKLLPEPRSRRFVHLEQRLALGGIRPLLVALFHFGQRHAKALCEQLHRLRESSLLVQLEELEDVATDLTAEAVEKTFVAVDVKRRRFLAVE